MLGQRICRRGRRACAAIPFLLEAEFAQAQMGIRGQAGNPAQRYVLLLGKASLLQCDGVGHDEGRSRGRLAGHEAGEKVVRALALVGRRLDSHLGQQHLAGIRLRIEIDREHAHAIVTGQPVGQHHGRRGFADLALEIGDRSGECGQTSMSPDIR